MKIIFRFLIGLILIGGIAAASLMFLTKKHVLKTSQDTEDEISTQVFRTDPIQKEDSNKVSFMTHARRWVDYNHNEYSVKFLARESNYIQSTSHRQELETSDFEAVMLHEKVKKNRNEYPFVVYYNWLYRNLHSHNIALFPHLSYSLDSLRHQYDLNKREFCDLIVSMIQDLPYTYLSKKSCDHAKKSCECNCLERVKHGIHAPGEFVFNLYGDCDSRTLILYSVLNHFKYNVAILISKEYGHSMLGINIPSTGDHIYHKGLKYYFWETTARNWQAGELPPEYKNKKYWEIALCNR